MLAKHVSAEASAALMICQPSACRQQLSTSLRWDFAMLAHQESVQEAATKQRGEAVAAAHLLSTVYLNHAALVAVPCESVQHMQPLQHSHLTDNCNYAPAPKAQAFTLQGQLCGSRSSSVHC